MKSRSLLPALLAAFSLAATSLRAEKGHDHPGHDHKGHDHSDHGNKGQGKHDHAGHGHKGPDTTGPVLSVPDGMASLKKHLIEMERELAAGDPEGFHAHDDAVQLAVRGFDRDASLPPEKRKRVQGYVKNVRRLVHKIHHLAEGKKFEPAKKELGKLKAQVDLLEKQFAAGPSAPTVPGAPAKAGSAAP